MVYLDSTVLIWNLAAEEAFKTYYQFIEKVHLLMAFCRAHRSITPEKLRSFGMKNKAASISEVKKEINPVYHAFMDADVAPQRLYKVLEQLVGQGNCKDKYRSIIHRSEECKSIFWEAEDLAYREGTSSLYPVHLFKALLLDPCPTIIQALEKVKADPADFLLNLNDLILDDNPFQNQSSLDIPNLRRYGRDITELAESGKLKPIIGREKELEQIIQTLLRLEKSNPILIGEPGVGKTALVEGLAQRIVDFDVPRELRNRRIIEINLNSLVAGTIYRGQFEERIERIIREARENPQVILFIDEIHNLLGAGSAIGAMDAANILKPVLSRGEIRVIGATTIDEYRQYFERDKALSRRFEPIFIKEPDPEETFHILVGQKERYHEHYEIEITDEAIKRAIYLTSRYCPDRYFPDKAIDLLDNACAYLKIRALQDSFARKEESFRLSPEIVDCTFSERTGIPITPDSHQVLIQLADKLKQTIIGQDDAIDKVVKSLMVFSQFSETNRPKGVFLFIGPTGVGKTALALALAKALFGAENRIIRLDMSEFKEPHSVAKLIGAPPGYVGYGEGGQLTEQLKKQPYSVVLLDEIEKAHPEVLDLFLQLFGEGHLTDSLGRTIPAYNATFIMTSNLGMESVLKLERPVGFLETENFPSSWPEKVLSKLKTAFRPEFLNRIDEIIFFNPLTPDVLKKIVVQKLSPIIEKLSREKGIELCYEEEVLDFLVEKGSSLFEGARGIKKAIHRHFEIPLSEILIRHPQGGFSLRVRKGSGRLEFKMDLSTMSCKLFSW